MDLSVPLAAFTMLHVALSLIGIASGIAVLLGLLAGRQIEALTAVFLVSTILTSVTGFLFPVTSFGPSHAIGVLSLVALAAAVIALYGLNLAGRWRATYIVTSVLALYFNVFVGIVQAFQKVPYLRALAPTQSEQPFVISQAIAATLLLLAGTAALKLFHPEAKPFA